MMLIKNLRIILIILVIYFFLTPKPSYAYTIFQDNFNDNDISDWVVERNAQWSNPSQPCFNNTQPTTWQAINGRAGMIIKYSAGCESILAPKNLTFQENIDYSFSFDMEFTNNSQQDRNVIFKYLNTSNWYDFLFSGNKLHFQKVVGSYYRLETIDRTFQANQIYHFQIDYYKKDLSTRKIDLYINNNKIWSLDDYAPFFNSKSIALQASVGANPSSEVWFDNVVVDSIPLNVPYISQIDPAWKNNSYNFLAGKNISELGCALTSAAMILKYHGINSLPDNSELNPGTLNNWLKNRPDGYIKGDLNWEAIAVLAKKVHDVQGAGTKLLFRWGSGSQTEINNDLNSLQPVVLEINSADSPSGKHYVVAKGPAETGFEISDPLTADNNTLNSLNSTRRFIPTNTDLSALYLVADPEVNILVTDAAGRKLGKSGNNNFSQIPDAVFGTGGEIADDQNSGYTTPKYSFVFVASPSGQVFDVQLQSPILKNYTLTNYSYDQDGEVKIATSSGIISSDFLPEHNLFYSSSTASASTAEKKVTFTTAVKEVNNAKELNQISRSSLTLTLKRILSAAEKETKPTPRKRILNVFLRELDRQKDKAISESAYSILKEDALYLLNH